MGRVYLTQYIHPRGRKREVNVELPDDVCLLARDQVLSCECAPHDHSKVILYSHMKDAGPDPSEFMLLANNDLGKNSPPKVLERLIRKVDAANKKGEG